MEDPVSIIEVEKAETALKHMASKKASEPTGAVAEMLRTGMERRGGGGGGSCLEPLTRIFNDMLFENTSLGDWVLSLLVPI